MINQFNALNHQDHIPNHQINDSPPCQRKTKIHSPMNIITPHPIHLYNPNQLERGRWRRDGILFKTPKYRMIEVGMGRRGGKGKILGLGLRVRLVRGGLGIRRKLRKRIRFGDLGDCRSERRGTIGGERMRLYRIGHLLDVYHAYGESNPIVTRMTSYSTVV
jgi:hypothetical protein